MGFLVLPSATRYAVLGVALGFSVGLPAIAIAADRYHDADAKAARGDAAAAEAAYDKLLKKTPDDARALNGRATARAWAGKHDAAQADYRAVLARDPNNLQALTGIGYSYAWNKQYAEAERSFKAALALAPDNAGATKGLGFTYLWSGQHANARKVFEGASARWPNDAEIKTALAQAQPVAAVKEAPQAAPRRMWGELHVWAGTTSNGDTGLRSVEAAYWPHDDWRLALRYDNSLSLDNPALARTGADAETYYASVLHQFNEHWQGLAEFGYRDLPGGDDQQIYRVEAVHLDGTNVHKLGVQISPHSDGYTDELVYASYGFEVAKGWRIEPAVFYANTGASDDNEWRGIVHVEYRDEDGWSAAVGVGGGVIDSDIPGNEGGVFVADGRISIPIADDYEAHVMVRHEEAPNNDYTTVMVGLTFRFGD